MKYLLLSIFCLLSVFGFTQSTLPLRADTVLIEKSGGSGELKIKNSTRDSLGVLVNIGGGKTRFMRAKALNDSTLVIGLDTIRISGGTATNLVARNGLTESNDTLYLGGDLTKWTWIKTYSNRTETPFAPNENALVIGNEIIPDSSNYWWLSVNDASTSIYDKSNIYLSRTYKADDTVYKNYGGNISATTFTNYGQFKPKYKNQSTPIILPYGNMSANHVLHPPDTSYWQTGPYGHNANFGADLRVGGTWPYRTTIFSQSNISGPYPMTVYRGGIDLAHRSSTIKRESYGNGYVSYVSDFRNHQATVNAGSTELGSYVSKIGGFYAYGNLAPFTASPSKAKTLAVSTADTVFGFWAAPQYTDLNETKNGYGYIAQGTQDDNYFAGRFRLGGSLPLHATVMRTFHNTGTSEFTDTVYMSKLLKLGFGTATPASGSFNIYMDTGFQAGYSYGNQVYSSIAQYQTGITAANYNSKRRKGLIVEMDWEYSDPAVDITDKFQRAVLGYANVIADDFLNVSSTNGGVGGSEFGLLYRKRTGFTDTTVFQGGATPYLSPWALSGTLDMTGSAASSVTRLNWAKGYHTALNAKVSWNQWHRVSNAIWLRTGDVQSGGANSQVDTGYQIYMLPSDSRVLIKYGIFQPGTLDTNYLAGPLRLPNLPIGGSSDSALVKKANGVIATVAQSSIVAAAPALTTNQIGVGIASVLGGYSSFTYDGTSVKQENSGAISAITSTTAVGASSGGVLNLYAKDLPTAANQVLGTINLGSRNGTTADNVGIRLRASTNGAWTDGSAEQAYFTIETNATGTLNEQFRATANGRTSIGGVANPNSRLQIAAGSTALAPLSLTTGSVLTTPVAGALEWDASANGGAPTFTPVSTRFKTVLSNTGAATDGQIPIGSTSSGVYTSATLTGSTSVGVTNGAGSITLSVPTSYLAAGDYVPTLTGTLNVDAVTLVDAHYTRTNDIVDVDLYVSVDPTASGTSTNFSVTLPIASTMTNFTNLTGLANPGEGTNGQVVCVSNIARVGYTSGGTSSTGMNIHFKYRIQ